MVAKIVYSFFVMGQLCLVIALSLVLPLGLPPSPTVAEVVLAVKAFVCRNQLL
jgi:hypothetical protein